MPTALILVAAFLACGDKDDTGGSGDGGTDDGGMDMDGGMDVDTGSLDFGTSATTDGGTYTVTYTPSTDPIPFNTEFSLDIAATADVMPEGGFTVSAADATMPAHGHGMNVAPVVSDNKDGTWTAAPFLFHMEGWWEISVDVTSDAGTETAVFNVWCCE